MNKVITTTLTAVAALFIAFNASATEAPFSLYVSKTAESKKIVLRLENMFADKVNCAIYSEQGALIFTDEIYTANNTSKKYDLNQLPAGEYVIEITDLMKVERLKINVTATNVEFAETQADITYKPTVWINEDAIVDFNLLALGNTVNVAIKSENGDEIYTKRFANETSIGSRLNLSELPTGTYTMIVTNGSETFYHYLSI